MEANERVEDEEEKQELWSWGAGTDGQLGTGKLQDEHVPQLLPVLPSLSLLSCGGAHVIALTHGKKVLTWGRGTSGQLGHGDLVNSLEPKSVEVLNNFNITHVSAGWNHSGFVSECGYLFTCGDGSFGQLGHGDYVSQSSPVKVSHLASRHVCEIACGMRHSLALLKGEHGDQVYGFGSGKRGQLGISKEKVKSVSLPQSVSGLQEVDVSSISANGDHSAALSSDAHLYTWGRGFGGTPDVCCPNRVISRYSFKQAALGWNHALLLTDEGDILMLGGSHHGVLSNPQKEISVNQDLDQGQVKEIPGLDRIKVAGVASGSEHSVITTENGVIMTWGWGEHGQLGLGDTCDHTCPQVVNMAQNAAHEYTTSRVYCGSGFTFVVRAWRPR
ncbi:putative regulator of chromosome condensation 1/beta-lactamase-inhibitor protein II [Helianthus annuus]|nr:putative regulator of chromosome condensation 1/beta-lactamase-inhibitor protein II [Helianthus annuus]KAJ0631883.1 putative regulator of chromosome condensation 1/beta-lactamase-inhibitor protein II [Helianthus annuus]KAJ0825658.1 putative regulator of chromosome condensation 1/beta-lactamase-inhibitor protein II [Helianthus annuus]